MQLCSRYAGYKEVFDNVALTYNAAHTHIKVLWDFMWLTK